MKKKPQATRNYYVLADSFLLARNKKEYSYGFCNAKQAYAFESKAARQRFLDDTYDLSARAITRKEAERFAWRFEYDGEDHGMILEYGDKDLYNEDTNEFQFVQIRKPVF
jgi:hypothetical protein